MVTRNKAATELKGFVQRTRHLLTGLLIRAHVLYAGQQLVQALPEEHLGLWTLRRGAAAAVRPQARTVCEWVHVWEKNPTLLMFGAVFSCCVFFPSDHRSGVLAEWGHVMCSSLKIKMKVSPNWSDLYGCSSCSSGCQVQNGWKTAERGLWQSSLCSSWQNEQQGCGVLSGMWARVRFGL